MTSIPSGRSHEPIERWYFPSSGAYGKTRTATGRGLISGLRIRLLFQGELFYFRVCPPFRPELLHLNLIQLFQHVCEPKQAFFDQVEDGVYEATQARGTGQQWTSLRVGQS